MFMQIKKLHSKRINRGLLAVFFWMFVQGQFISAEELPQGVLTGWQDYLHEVAHVQGACTWYLCECDENWIETSFKDKYSIRILWVGMSIRQEIKSTIGDATPGSFAKIQNGDYGADLAQGGKEKKQWHIDNLRGAPPDEIDSEQLSGQPLSGALHWVTVGVCLYPAFLPEFFSRPTVKILKIEEDAIDGKRAVWVHFQDNVPKSSEKHRMSGKIALLPDHHWIVRKAVWIEDYSWSTGSHHGVSEIDIEYQDSPNTQLLLPKLYTVKSVVRNKPGGEPQNFMLLTKTFDLEFVDPESISEDEFRLSSFGLPEPYPIQRSRWWIVLMTIGVGLIGAWWFVSAKDRKAA